MMKHELTRYDAYKDSGAEWIGEVPKHWDINRIKDHTYVKGRIGWQGLRNSDFLHEGDFYCVTGTDLKNGVIDWSNCYYIPENRYEQDKFIQLKVNDLLITKDGTIGKVALVYELPKKSTLNSGVFVTRPFRCIYTNEYMYWVLCSSIFRDYIDLNKGGSTIQHLYQNVFERFSYPCPLLPEQKSIADYLYIKTAQIDRKIDLLTQKATLYGKLRQSLINETVNRGLDKTVAMKDSGVEWIGKVPKHWDVLPLKELASKSTGSFVDGPFGSDLKSNEYTDEGVPLIQLNNIGIGFHSTKNIKFISEDKSLLLSKHRAFPGEIAIAKMAEPVARATVISNAFPMYVIVADCIKFKPNSRILDNNFIAYALNTTGVKSQAEILSNGTTRIRINLGTTKILKVVTPPLPEQKAIANYLDIKTSHIDRIITTINTQIDKLKELRKTLINDVATGKIKVV